MSEIHDCRICKKKTKFIRTKDVKLDCFPYRWSCEGCESGIEEEFGMDALWAMEERYKKRCSEAAKKAHETMRLKFKKKHKVLDKFME